MELNEILVGKDKEKNIDCPMSNTQGEKAEKGIGTFLGVEF